MKSLVALEKTKTKLDLLFSWILSAKTPAKSPLAGQTNDSVPGDYWNPWLPWKNQNKIGFVIFLDIERQTTR